jgi:hypothetical protein
MIVSLRFARSRHGTGLPMSASSCVSLRETAQTANRRFGKARLLTT